MAKKRFISYEEYGNLLQLLMLKLEGLTPKVILAIPRGGLAIGLHVSHHLNCSDLFTLPIKDESIATFMKNHLQQAQILIVDDVCDSSSTLKQLTDTLIRNNIVNFKIATIHVKPRRIIEPDFYIEEVSNECCLVYPWEYNTEPNKEYMKYNELKSHGSYCA